MSRPGDWTCPGCAENCFAWRDTCRTCNTSRPGGDSFSLNANSGDIGAPLDNMKKAGDWNCPGCGQLVFAWRDSCRSCNTPRAAGGGGGGGKGGGKDARPGDWNCPKCGELCFKWRDSCRSCGATKSAGGGGGGLGGGAGGLDAGLLTNLVASLTGGQVIPGGGGARTGPQRDGDWNCPTCGELCFKWRDACRTCNTPRAAGGGGAIGGSVPRGGMSKAGDWNCPGCGDLCFSYRDTCRQCNTPRPAGGGGGGGARFSPYGGGGGKGHGKKGDKLQFDKAKTVWIGGLPDGTTNDELLELGKSAPNCMQAVVVKSGTGLIEYGGPEDVALAIPVLSGAILKDSMIQADFWQK